MLQLQLLKINTIVEAVATAVVAEVKEILLLESSCLSVFQCVACGSGTSACATSFKSLTCVDNYFESSGACT